MVARDRMMPQSESAAASSLDADRTRQIAQRLRQQIPGGDRILVSVRDDTAWLYGSVNSEAQREEAARIVANTTGIQEVQNELRVAGMAEQNGFYQPWGYVPTEPSRQRAGSQRP
jgi:osmotically-inducible protein OsmY